MPTLCVPVRERWRALSVSPDQVLAVLLLALLLVATGRQWPTLLPNAGLGPTLQQAALDDEYVFED